MAFNSPVFFASLFLVIIRCYNKIRGKMILDFILELFHGNHGVIGSALKHPENLCHKLVVLLCDNVCVRSFGIFFLQKKFRASAFERKGKRSSLMLM